MAYTPATVTVKVTLMGDNKATFEISVAPDPVHVGGNEGVEWVIDGGSTDWTFTKDRRGDSDGIDIKDPKGNFGNEKGDPTRKKHKWKRLKMDYQPYPYTICVTNNPSGVPATTLVLDPTMIND